MWRVPEKGELIESELGGLGERKDAFEADVRCIRVEGSCGNQVRLARSLSAENDGVGRV